MKRLKIFAALVLIIGLFFSTTILAEEDRTQYYAKYLSVADVEQVTGLKGITTKHNYTLHFHNADGIEILRVSFYSVKDWDFYVSDDKSLWAPVEGIGDRAAYEVPRMPYMLAFAKGHHMVILGTTRKEGLTMHLSLDQLKALANIILPRLPKEDYL